MLKNGFYQRKKLKYKKKNFFFTLDQNTQLMSSFIQAREKGAKKAKKGLKKWTLPKQKLKYINNKTFYQKSAGLRFLPV